MLNVTTVPQNLSAYRFWPWFPTSNQFPPPALGPARPQCRVVSLHHIYRNFRLLVNHTHLKQMCCVLVLDHFNKDWLIHALIIKPTMILPTLNSSPQTRTIWRTSTSTCMWKEALLLSNMRKAPQTPAVPWNAQLILHCHVKQRNGRRMLCWQNGLSGCMGKLKQPSFQTVPLGHVSHHHPSLDSFFQKRCGNKLMVLIQRWEPLTQGQPMVWGWENLCQ